MDIIYKFFVGADNVILIALLKSVPFSRHERGLLFLSYGTVREIIRGKRQWNIHLLIGMNINIYLTPVSSSGFTILDSAPDFVSLRILGSLHIFKLNLSINDTNSSFPLHIVK